MGDRISSHSPARDSRQTPLRPGQIFDPVARALDVIGDRWTLVLVRQLLSGPKGFKELRTRTGIAPRVLSARLRQLVADGFVEPTAAEGPAGYALTDRGASLEPVVASLARWWVRHGIRELSIDLGRFTETSPQSVLEALPFLVREDSARDAEVTFEIRLTGEGGGAWTVTIDHGACRVERGFADRADVRYTADARAWCGLALGLKDGRDLMARGLLTKDGGRQALDHYFHQLSSDGVGRRSSKPGSARESGSTQKRSTT